MRWQSEHFTLGADGIVASGCKASRYVSKVLKTGLLISQFAGLSRRVGGSFATSTREHSSSGWALRSRRLRGCLVAYSVAHKPESQPVHPNSKRCPNPLPPARMCLLHSSCPRRLADAPTSLQTLRVALRICIACNHQYTMET